MQKHLPGKALAASLIVMTSKSMLSDARRKELLTTIQGESNDWIQKRPLLEVSFRLMALHHISSLELTGDRLAKLTQRLTKDETAPGGPYNASSYNVQLTNLAIQRLLTLLGISLGGLDSYLLSPIPQDLSIFEKKALDVLRSNAPKHRRPPSARDRKFTDDVVKQTQLYLLGIDNGVDALMGRMIQKVRQVDHNGEVSCLALDFYRSLAKKPRQLTRKILVDIGVANYCAWIAYAIYDDFIDDEGKSQLLPIANIAHRYSIMRYEEVAKALGVSSRNTIRSLDSVDVGSIIELQLFRAKIVDASIIEIPSLPDYKDFGFLSERAFGFLAGPLLILEMLAETKKSKKSLMTKGLSTFIEARQICDDLTDWRSDLHSGKLSSVVTRALADARVRPYAYAIQDLDRLLSAQLWKSTFVSTTDIIKHKVAKSKSLIKSSGIFNEDMLFYNLYIEPLAEAAANLENDHALKKSFLKEYDT